MVSPVFYLSRNKILLPLLVIISLVIVALVNFFGPIIILIVIGLVGLITVTFIAYKFPRYNVVFMLSLAFLMPFFIKVFGLYSIPISNAIEGLCLLLFVILLFKRKINGFATLPGVLLTAWIIFQIIEVVNPNAFSRTASIIAIRSLIPVLCGFYVAFASIESKRDALVYFISIMLLGSLAGVYGLYQEFAGLPSYDLKWATHDERLYNLLFTWGRLRKFSFFFSPSDFGMIMAIVGTAAWIGFFLIKRWSLKIFCAFAGSICIWSMLYSGTRTAMVMMVIGFVIFALITLNKKVLIACACIALALTALVLRPTSSRTLFVMMTAFYAADDPSMNVRIRNQQLIRSHIQQNPLGFGMGTTGYLGMKYAPHTFIGSFPPDSEFVKIAIETGWVGLLFWCTVLSVIFAYGINIYFKTQDEEWKTILTVMLVMLFMMIVAQYPQEFFRSHVLAMMFSFTVAILAKIGDKQRKVTSAEVQTL